MSMYGINFPESLKTNSNFYQSFQNKRLLRKLRKQVVNYSATFSSTLTNHLKSEFEINVRENKITPEGFEKLEQLQKEFQILQYEENLKAMLDNCKLFCKTQVSKLLLDVFMKKF